MMNHRLSLAALILACPLLVATSQVQTHPIKFRDVTKAAGLYEPLAGIMGHGAAVGDFDGDGKVDIYVGGFCDRPNAEYKPAQGPVPSRPWILPGRYMSMSPRTLTRSVRSRSAF